MWLAASTKRTLAWDGMLVPATSVQSPLSLLNNTQGLAAKAILSLFCFAFSHLIKNSGYRLTLSHSFP